MRGRSRPFRDTPADNAQFLVFLAAVIKAVDEYQDLIRLSAASAGNDHRLGASEAPPAIVSMFLGDELTEILDCLVSGRPYQGREKALMEIGATVLPHFPKDNTDRNRTSPFAFTGNKFEFRMPGSAFSVSGPNIVLNTIVAEELSGFASILEKSTDFNKDLKHIIISTIKKHKRIIFNGDGYSKEWEQEAEKRGLLNMKTTPEALPSFIAEKNIRLFKKHGVFTESELRSRYEILMENYCKIIRIEAKTMVEMVHKYVVPAGIRFQKFLAETISLVNGLVSPERTKKETALLDSVCVLLDDITEKLAVLEEKSADSAMDFQSAYEEGVFVRDEIFMNMEKLRVPVDKLEKLVPPDLWRLPAYGEILYSVD